MSTPWREPDEDHEQEEEIVAEGMSYLLEQAIGADPCFNEADPTVAILKTNAILMLLARIGVELTIIRHELTGDDSNDEPWRK